MIAASAAQTITAVQDALRRASNSRKASKPIWALIAAVDKFIVEQAPWKLAKDPDAEPRSSTRRSTPPRRRCASSPRCSRRCCRNRPRRSGRSSACTDPLDSVRFDDAALGQLAGRPEDRRSRGRVPAHRAEGCRRRRMRELEEKISRGAGRAAGQEAGAPAAATPMRRRSPSTISSKSICASAWCCPPSA